MTALLQRWLVRAYGIAARSGILASAPVEHLMVGAFFAYKRWLEDPFASVTRRYPQWFRGGHVIDVGANVGYTAAVFARVVDAPYRIWALEPEPVNFARLQRVLARRGLTDRVIAIQTAAGDESGIASLALNETHPGDHHIVGAREARESRKCIEVPMTTLDALVAERIRGPVSFVKIDVQGFEESVSRGMETVLASNPRVVVALEYTVGEEHDPEALLEFYAERGFGVQAIAHDGELLPLDHPRIRRTLAARGYSDIICRREGAA